MYQAIGALGGMYLDSQAAQQQHQAMTNASQQYNQNLQDYYGREQAANTGFQQQYNDVGNRRLNRIGGALTDYMATPYGQNGTDTATAQKALGQVGSGVNPGANMGGAAMGWGNGVAERTGAATGRQIQVAGDANQLHRQQFGQGAALQAQGAADMGFQREHANIAQMEQFRQAALAQQLQNININGQNAFEHAGHAGERNLALSHYMKVGGMVADSFGGGQTRQPNAQPANPNWSPTGQQTGGGYYGAVTPQGQNWGPSASQAGGGYYGSLFQ